MSKVKAVFAIIENENMEKAIFRRVGSGFVNRDESINIYLDAFPKDGKLHMRDQLDKPEGEAPTQEKAAS